MEQGQRLRFEMRRGLLQLISKPLNIEPPSYELRPRHVDRNFVEINGTALLAGLAPVFGTS